MASKGLEKHEPPFPESQQLESTLSCVSTGESSELKLVISDGRSSCLPEQPDQDLETRSVLKFSLRELQTSELDEMASWILLFVSKRESSHVSSLTHQLVRGRKITITEEARLHGVWIGDRIFLKPIPTWLTSHAFWKLYCHEASNSEDKDNEASRLLRAASGYLRSYYYLVRRRSDFRLAVEADLVPENVEWKEFCDFISSFALIQDHQVSPRFRYGDLRLSRLNTWFRITFRGFYYQKVYGQYGDMFATLYAPILFTFGLLSLMLSALQGAFRDIPTASDASKPWLDFQHFMSKFALVIAGSTVCIGFGLLLTFLVLILRELVHMLVTLYRRPKRKTKT